jgi:type II secretory pathway pseudopilin PulG
MFFYKFFKTKKLLKSFTTIEMLISLAIITLISSLVFNFSKISQYQSELQAQADLIITDLKRVQDNSYLATEYMTGGSRVIPCGYGIRFYPDQYELVVNLNFSPAEGCSNICLALIPASALSENKKILKPIFELNLQPTFNSIVFLPPKGEAVFCNGSVLLNNIQQGTITLQIKGEPDNRIDIKVNSFGGISF